ncbi:MAG: hypothetical protein HC897_15845 [Thermoanaerobaculia bacterium]|nr:hypothetical protein [Thermoanaerobaculia bacterium]
MKYSFEVEYGDLRHNLEHYIDAILGSLESEFLVMPRGAGFVDYPEFEGAFQLLKRVSHGFMALEPDAVLSAVRDDALVLIVLRAMLGFTPPEWAYVTSRQAAVDVSQSYARSLDRRVRMAPGKGLRKVNEKVAALVRAACKILTSGAPETEPDRLHRLAKADTKLGIESIRHLADHGVPYALVLYERFLGRPFAGHRDSVSELVGGRLETRIEEILMKHGIGFRKTGRAAKIQDFDQAPDFIVPDEFNPKVIIEAKVTEDDGTARDKITRIQHLAELGGRGLPAGESRFEVIACIAGRGFGVRREDMRKLLLATAGKVFTLESLSFLVEGSRLKSFKTR